MRGSSYDSSSLANLEGLHSQSSGLVAIVDGNAADADEDAELVEPKVGDEAQGLLPVGADAGLSAQNPEASPAPSTMRGDAISKSSS